MHSKLLTDMFVLALPVAEKILRPIVVYFFLVIGLAPGGKTRAGAAQSLRSGCPAHAVEHRAERHHRRRQHRDRRNHRRGHAADRQLPRRAFSFRHEKLDRLVEGEATVLIEDGKILQGQTGSGKCFRCRISKPLRTSKALADLRRSGPRHARPERNDFLHRQETSTGGSSPPGSAGPPRSACARGGDSSPANRSSGALSPFSRHLSATAERMRQRPVPPSRQRFPGTKKISSPKAARGRKSPAQFQETLPRDRIGLLSLRRVRGFLFEILGLLFDFRLFLRVAFGFLLDIFRGLSRPAPCP